MELFATLGQFLLLSFVLPGFCYLAVAALCFPMRFQETLAALCKEDKPDKKEGSQGFWMTFLAVTGGLLLSSVAFAIEVVCRRLSMTFDCRWFPAIPFDKIVENTLANFFTAETFMHFNIAVGIFIILVIYLICRDNGARRKGWLVVSLAFVVAANLMVSGHLFDRPADVALEDADMSKWTAGCPERHQKKAWY